jgi:hypothetical protein
VVIISYLCAEGLEHAYQESRYQALHGPLINLPSRVQFLACLEQALIACFKTASLATGMAAANLRSFYR